ncbi:MAG: hypothetical protein GY830_10120 [Bacteroidetes bacterium]|nr:hypothetical protein [Bacteroidota bacterium]
MTYLNGNNYVGVVNCNFNNQCNNGNIDNCYNETNSNSKNKHIQKKSYSTSNNSFFNFLMKPFKWE